MDETLLTKQRRLPRIFPGWWLVVTGSFMNFWGAGYTVYGFSALLKPISSELGLSRAVASVAASISRIEGGIEAPVTGWLTDRFGPRRVTLIGVSLFGLGLISMNFVNSLWAFYLVWGVIIAIGSNASSGIPVITALANWFVKKRGLATGMRIMISAAFLLPFITWLITTYGWRIACVVGGVVWLVVGLPLTWFFIRDHRPEYYGLLPDGATTAEELKEDTSQMIKRGAEYATKVEEIEFTLRQTLRTPAYWLLIVAGIGPGIASGALMVHLIPFLTDIGLDPSEAAAAVAIAGLFSLVARFASGLFADRVKKEHMRFLLGGADLLLASGIALFVLNQTIAMVYPFLILYFVGSAANFVIPPLISGRYFGRKAFGSIRGTSAMLTMPIGILAPVYLGWVYDTSGSYATAFALIVALIALSAVLVCLARPPKPPAHIAGVDKIV